MQTHVSFGVTLRVWPVSLTFVIYLLNLYSLCLVCHSFLMSSSWACAMPDILASRDWTCMQRFYKS